MLLDTDTGNVLNIKFESKKQATNVRLNKYI